MFKNSDIHFSEYKVKFDLIDREDEDSVEYSMKSTWFFNPKKSNGLTGEEDMVFPHLMILSMAIMTLKDKPAAMPVVGTYIHIIISFQCRVLIAVTYRSRIAYRVGRSTRTITMHAGWFKVGHEKDTSLYNAYMYLCQECALIFLSS